MSADYFLDTNLLVYSFDEKAPLKQETSKKLIAKAIRTGCGTQSYSWLDSARPLRQAQD